MICQLWRRIWYLHRKGKIWNNSTLDLQNWIGKRKRMKRAHHEENRLRMTNLKTIGISKFFAFPYILCAHPFLHFPLETTHVSPIYSKVKLIHQMIFSFGGAKSYPCREVGKQWTTTYECHKEFFVLFFLFFFLHISMTTEGLSVFIKWILATTLREEVNG